MIGIRFSVFRSFPVQPITRLSVEITIPARALSPIKMTCLGLIGRIASFSRHRS